MRQEFTYPAAAAVAVKRWEAAAFARAGLDPTALPSARRELERLEAAVGTQPAPQQHKAEG